MGANTKIEWCDHTFNPWVGCQNVSPGCDHCYAEALAKRTGMVEWGPHAERRRTSAAYWRQPFRWARKAAEAGVRHRVFCASMADVFDNKVPRAWQLQLFVLIRGTPELDWLLLTKRPENMAAMLPCDWRDDYPNVWLGVTAEDQDRADHRVPILLDTAAAKRFVSYEPALGPVRMPGMYAVGEDGVVDTPALDWVIAGGESGPKARPAHPDWFRAVRDQCAAAGVPYFHKQNGEWVAGELVKDDRRYSTKQWDGDKWSDCSDDWIDEADGGTIMYRVGKKAAGAELDGREHRETP